MSPIRNRLVVVTCIFAAVVCGILYLSWKDIYSNVPKFEQLQEARANGFRVDIRSLEFFDEWGKRYQVKGAKKAERDLIATALSGDESVILRYGRWLSPFPSTKIFTVYQVEVEARIIIPYERLEGAKQREQAAGPMIMVCTILVTAFVIFKGFRSEMKFQRELELAKSNHLNKTKNQQVR